MTTDGQVDQFFTRWAEAGQDLRKTWLNEMQNAAKHGQWEDLQYLLQMDDISDESKDLIAAIMDVGQWWKDAPRRNAKKKRRKTQEPGVNWQRELAAHFRREDASGKLTRLAKFRSLPREHEEPLRLCEGIWEIWRDNDGRIVCADKNGLTKSISYATFEGYMKEKPPVE